MTEVTTTMSFDDFCGRCCDVGFDVDLAVTGNAQNICQKPIVSYYIRSLPDTKRVAVDDFRASAFQRACVEWGKYSNISFNRLPPSQKDLADFVEIKMKRKSLLESSENK